MTSATSASNSLSRRPALRGFSLIELLVVIGIILVLAGIALPMLIKAYAQADKTKARSDLNTIALCLEAYKNDFADYPRAIGETTTDRGARVLCRALVGPGDAGVDGATGNGFRVRKSAGPDNTMDTSDDIGMGKIYGPYIQLDRFRIGGTTPNFTLNNKDDKPILYYVASPKTVDVTQATAGVNGYVGNVSPSSPSFRYSYADNSASGLYTAAQNTFQAMLGDFLTVNNKLDAGETFTNQPFILWSPGADGSYGPSAATKAGVAGCDDVTNIEK